MNCFLSLEDSEEKVESWRRHYSSEWLQSALGKPDPKGIRRVVCVVVCVVVQRKCPPKCSGKMSVGMVLSY